MENFLDSPVLHKRLLLFCNLENESVAKLTEKLVQQPHVDLIVACGPLLGSCDITFSSKEEEDASKIADIGSIIAQLENIVCRVIYLPSQ
jgi:hypothetical protein